MAGKPPALHRKPGRAGMLTPGASVSAGSGYLEGKELQNLIQELQQARKKAGLVGSRCKGGKCITRSHKEPAGSSGFQGCKSLVTEKGEEEGLPKLCRVKRRRDRETKRDRERERGKKRQRYRHRGETETDRERGQDRETDEERARDREEETEGGERQRDTERQK